MRCKDFDRGYKGHIGAQGEYLLKGYFLLLLQLLFLFLAIKLRSPNCFFFHSGLDVVIITSRKKKLFCYPLAIGFVPEWGWTTTCNVPIFSFVPLYHTFFCCHESHKAMLVFLHSPIWSSESPALSYNFDIYGKIKGSWLSPLYLLFSWYV